MDLNVAEVAGGEKNPLLVSQQLVSVASGVVVRFKANSKNNLRGCARKRRDFFEHDTRKSKARRMKWSLGHGCGKGKGAEQNTCGGGGGVGGGDGISRNVVPEKMNSKARRAAKFREMKFLQRIMLSKEVDFTQLLPTLATSPKIACCHCQCSSASATKGSDSVVASLLPPERDSHSVTTCAEAVVVRKEVEVVNCCPVR